LRVLIIARLRAKSRMTTTSMMTMGMQCLIGFIKGLFPQRL
jgi:hypothetical protein